MSILKYTWKTRNSAENVLSSEYRGIINVNSMRNIKILRQKSIAPIVFFKVSLFEYLNDIISDRKLIAYCSDSLSIRQFLEYDIYQQLTKYSTINRTRQFYEEELFLENLQTILSQCVKPGLVSGQTQSIDFYFVKANASVDCLELKVPKEKRSNSEKSVTSTHKRYQTSEQLYAEGSLRFN